MLTEPLVTESGVIEAALPEFVHPQDSSRLLLGLMTLHKRAEKAAQAPAANDSLSGIVSKTVLRSLMSALHFRDVATVRHSRRVALLATGIAKHLGWESDQIK